FSTITPSPRELHHDYPAATISLDDDHYLKGYDRDLWKLYTKVGGVRDEIFFAEVNRFRSLEREQERATMTFNCYMEARVNHDLRMQIAEERHERLELTNHVARIERRQESRGE
ncbi:hypothetical protein Tco_0032476, partial [Tanacetum coccineum]